MRMLPQIDVMGELSLLRAVTLQDAISPTPSPQMIEAYPEVYGHGIGILRPDAVLRDAIKALPLFDPETRPSLLNIMLERYERLLCRQPNPDDECLTNADFAVFVDATAFRIGARTRGPVWDLIGVKPFTGRQMIHRATYRIPPSVTFTAAAAACIGWPTP